MTITTNNSDPMIVPAIVSLLFLESEGQKHYDCQKGCNNKFHLLAEQMTPAILLLLQVL